MKGMTAKGLGIVCGIGASGLGIAYLALAGAPLPYLAIQTAALAIGLVALLIVKRIGGRLPSDAGSSVVLLLAGALMATALFGPSIEGAARWVRFGAVYLQTSLILIPPMLLLFARGSGPMSAGGMILAAAALALQPDRAMAGVVAAGLGSLAFVRRDGWTLAAAASAAAAFLATLAQPDNLPAVPFVDQILYTAFDVHLAAGLAVLGGSLMLVLPMLGSGDRSARLVFGIMWIAIVAAAALGNYPTPVVGYGGSAVLGYLLSVALLPGMPRAREAAAPSRSARGGASEGDGSLRVAAAA
jgi:cell division protein FtsW (lipid II flippase)